MNKAQIWMILQLAQIERVKLIQQKEANEARKGLSFQFYSDAVESNLKIVDSIIEELNTNVNANIN